MPFDENLSELEKLALPGVVQAAIDKHGKADTHLVGIDGNAYAIMKHLERQLKRQGWPQDAIEALKALMTSGTYEELLVLAMRVVDDPVKGVDEYEAWKDITG